MTLLKRNLVIIYLLEMLVIFSISSLLVGSRSSNETRLHPPKEFSSLGLAVDNSTKIDRIVQQEQNTSKGSIEYDENELPDKAIIQLLEGIVAAYKQDQHMIEADGMRSSLKSDSRFSLPDLRDIFRAFDPRKFLQALFSPIRKPDAPVINMKPINDSHSQNTIPSLKTQMPTEAPVQLITTTTMVPIKNTKSPEEALNPSGVKCGKVPIYEKAYHRSINETAESEGQSRILHGLDSIYGEWPWIVRITECQTENSCGYCTGTLLNDRWIITAGHCFFGKKDLTIFNATLGLYDLISPEETSFTLGIDKVIVHNDYHDLTNDLSLIRLANRVNFSDYIQPACLVRPTRNVVHYAKDKICYNVGYGLVDGMTEPLKLQKLRIAAKEPSECNSDKLGVVLLRPGTVCIGPPGNNIGSSCKGDSGGPDLCYEPKSQQWEIFGTVSYGPSVCDREEDSKWVTVSADLSNYRTWILETIGKHSN